MGEFTVAVARAGNPFSATLASPGGKHTVMVLGLIEIGCRMVSAPIYMRELTTSRVCLEKEEKRCGDAFLYVDCSKMKHDLSSFPHPHQACMGLQGRHIWYRQRGISLFLALFIIVHSADLNERRENVQTNETSMVSSVSGVRLHVELDGGNCSRDQNAHVRVAGADLVPGKSVADDVNVVPICKLDRITLLPCEEAHRVQRKLKLGTGSEEGRSHTLSHACWAVRNFGRKGTKEEEDRREKPHRDPTRSAISAEALPLSASNTSREKQNEVRTKVVPCTHLSIRS